MDAANNFFVNELNKFPLRLYYQDEARSGRINTVQKCWCVKGVVPAVTQKMVREYTYLFTAVCPETGKTCSLIMPAANTGAMDIFLKTLSEEQKEERIILCMDKAAWHTTKQLQMPDNIIVWYLPPYTPELNPVELIWRELRGKYFNNKTFQPLDKVDDHLAFAINDYTRDANKIKQLTKFSILYY